MMKSTFFSLIAIVLLLAPGVAAAHHLPISVGTVVNASINSPLVLVKAEGKNEIRGEGKAWGKIKKEFKVIRENDNNDDDRLEREFDAAGVAHPQTMMGTVTMVSGTIFTITTEGNAMITVDGANARVVRRFGAPMELAEIMVNDRVQARGEREGNRLVATFIRDLSVQARQGEFRGEILSINTTSQSFVLRTKERGDQTVMITASTTVKKNGSPAVFADLAVGQHVFVSGVWNRTNNIVWAKVVNVVMRWQPIFIQGTVTTKTDSTITVRVTQDAVYTIDSNRAMFLSHFYRIVTLADVRVGDSVRVGGVHLNDSTHITAFVVHDRSVTSTP